jgi:hypothetical protein
MRPVDRFDHPRQSTHIGSARSYLTLSTLAAVLQPGTVTLITG